MSTPKGNKLTYISYNGTVRLMSWVSIYVYFKCTAVLKFSMLPINTCGYR